MTLSGSTSNSFSVVRQGYDADEVEAFLHNQAAAWQHAVDAVEERAREFEHQLELSRRREATFIDEIAAAANSREVALAEVEIELATARAAHEQAMNQLRNETEASVTKKLGDTESAIALRLQEASATHVELEKSRAAQLANLDTQHAVTMGRYQQAETKLVETIRELNMMRLTLIDGLEAIADGGLSNAKEIDDLMEEIGIISET